MHPNTLFVSWENWIPSYSRNEFKKKTGIAVDEKGNIIQKTDEDGNIIDSNDPNAQLLNTSNNNNTSNNSKKQYTPVGQYKPTGNLVYNQDILEKLEKKVSFS